MKLNPRSRTLYDNLTEELRNFPHGSRFYSMREIINRYRCGQRIAVAALERMEAERLIRRESRVGIFSNLSEGQNRKHILLLMPDWPSFLLKERGRLLTEQIRAYDWRVSVRFYDPESEEYMKDSPGEIDALVFNCASSSVSRRQAEWLLALQERFAVVMIGGHPGDFALNYVGSMDEFSGFEAMNYLYGLGHRRILMTLSEPHNFGVMRRLFGVEHFAATHPDVHVEFLDCRTISGESAMQRNYEEMSRRCRDRMDFTAIYADSSDSAAGTYKAFYESGIRIPDDVSIIANDIQNEGLFYTPPLTMIGMPSGRLTTAVVDGLSEVFSGSRKRFLRELSPEIVEQKSTAVVTAKNITQP